MKPVTLLFTFVQIGLYPDDLLTQLQYTMAYGAHVIAQFLLEHGVDTNTKNFLFVPTEPLMHYDIN